MTSFSYATAPQRDTTSALVLPNTVRWDDVIGLMLLTKSGRNADIEALSAPVYRCTLFGNASGSFCTLRQIEDSQDVSGYHNDPHWWSVVGVGYFRTLEDVLRLYEVSMRDPVREVYVTYGTGHWLNRRGGMQQAELHPHYRKFLAAREALFNRESAPEYVERAETEIVQARLRATLNGRRPA